MKLKLPARLFFLSQGLQGLSQAVVGANQVGIQSDGPAIFGFGSFRLLLFEIALCELEVSGGFARISGRGPTEKPFGLLQPAMLQLDRPGTPIGPGE